MRRRGRGARRQQSAAAARSSSEELTGTIRIDGSSTVFPFAEAAGELFNEEQPGVQVTVGESGTGGGFEKFCAGETDISNASRPIKDDEEAPICEKAGIKYEEITGGQRRHRGGDQQGARRSTASRSTS